jgi:hypothetical protein
MPSSPPSASSSTTRWSPSRRKIPRSRALSKDYNRPALDKHRLGELIDLIVTIGLGDAENRSKDILGRVYEYFLSQFASAEGKKGGEFYTPKRRAAVDCLSGADFEPGVAQNWAQFFVSEKSEEAKSLEGNGEPPRTRTWNPQIKSLLLYH